MSINTYLYGKNPLKEALIFGKKKSIKPIKTLFLTKASAQEDSIMSLVQANNIAYKIITSAEIESYVGRDAVHQGVLALLDDKALYTSFEEMECIISHNDRPLLVLLDELQDPHNVGAIIRSAVAFGADAILMPEHNQTQITATVIKSSSGTNFLIPIVPIGNVNTALQKLKKKGYWIYALTRNGDTSLSSTSFDSPSIVIIGSEWKGIAKKTLEYCDFKISIPIAPLCESLNASNAVAITLYEWRKQQVE